MGKFQMRVGVVGVLALALAACSSGSTTVAPSVSPQQTGLIQRATYARVSTTDEQRGTCAGVPEPEVLDRIVGTAVIRKVTVCMPDDEIVMVGKEGLSQDTINQLVHRWSIPDKTASFSPCSLPTASLVSVVMEDASGDKWRPAIPKDECGRPEAKADEAIGAILQNAEFFNMQSASASPSP